MTFETPNNPRGTVKAGSPYESRLWQTLNTSHPGGISPPYYESFEKDDGAGLGPDLTWNPDASWSTINGQAYRSDSGSNYAYTADTPNSVAMWAEIVVASHNTASVGCLCNADGATGSGYLLLITTAGDIRVIRRENNTSNGDVIPLTNIGVQAVPFTIRVQHDGAGNLEVFAGGVSVATGFDSFGAPLTFTGGGVYASAAPPLIESFQTGAVVPTTLVETFDKADGAGLGPLIEWEEFGSWETWRSVARLTVGQASYASVVPFIGGLYQWAQATCKIHASSNVGLMLRMNGTDSDDGYQLAVSDSPQWKVNRRDGGVSTTLIDWTDIAGLIAPYKMVFSHDGETLRVYINDAEVGSVADSTYAGGHAGIYCSAMLNQIDDFSTSNSLYSPPAVYPLLGINSMQWALGDAVKFKLNESQKLVFGVSTVQADAGRNCVITIKNNFGQVVGTVPSFQFNVSGYSSLAANQVNAETESPEYTLDAGEYSATCEVGNGDTPTAFCVRTPQSQGTNVISNGDQFHSGPWGMLDGGNFVYAYSSIAKGFPRYVKDGASPAVAILPDLPFELSDRYHNCTSIIKTDSRYVVAATGHNKQMQAISATTVAGLASATPVNINSASSTYSWLASHGDSAICQTRYAGSDGWMVTEFPDVSDLTTGLVDYVLNDQNRVYPNTLVKATRDDGGPLYLFAWQYRDGTGYRSLHGSVYDPNEGAEGQWYNFAGDAVGTATRGTSPTNARYDNWAWKAATSAGGSEIVGVSINQLRYMMGPAALRVQQWNATTKLIQGGFPWTQISLDLDENVKQPTDFGYACFTGGSVVNALSSGNDPFGLNGTNCWRGPSCAFYDPGTDDHVIIIADRGIPGRDREYYWNTDKSNMYNDMMGHNLNIYHVSDPHSAADGDALKAKIAAVQVVDADTLGVGTDTKDEYLGIGNIRQFTDTRELYLNVGATGMDISQEAGTVQRLDLTPYLPEPPSDSPRPDLNNSFQTPVSADAWGQTAGPLPTGSPTALSACSWVRTTRKTNTTHFGVYNSNDAKRVWRISYNSSNDEVRVILSDNGTFDAGNSKDYGTNNGVSYADGTWHHIGFTWDGTTDTVKLYFDGVLETNPIVGNDAPITSLFDSVDEPLCVSSERSGQQAMFVGDQCDVRVYNRVLSDAEMATIATDKNNALIDNGLVAGWWLNQTSGTTAADWSGSGNTLNLNGPFVWLNEGPDNST